MFFNYLYVDVPLVGGTEQFSGFHSLAGQVDYYFVMTIYFSVQISNILNLNPHGSTRSSDFPACKQTNYHKPETKAI